MEVILPFLQKYESVIYALLGIVAFYYFQKLVTAWQDWRGTVFGIERDLALRRFQTTLTVFLLLVLFGTLEFVIVSFVVPAYPQLAVIPTPTLDLLATPTVTLPARVDAAAVRPTATVETTPTPEPEGCVVGQIEWIEPKPGQEMKDTVRLVGTVNVPNLGYYRYDYSTPESGMWVRIAGGTNPKVNGEIGFWNTNFIDPGDYLLRLVVFDNQDNQLPACVVLVRVVGEQQP